MPWPHWEEKIRAFLSQQDSSDCAHDSAHLERVVAAATNLAHTEQASLDVILPAAWLHDCVAVPKSSPLRSQASRLSAEKATSFLRSVGYPAQHLEGIAHAIAAHSFSAAITPDTIEAKVVQDADRLDALGAIGLARCLMLGGAVARPLYSGVDPFCRQRAPNDSAYTLDHFFTKLLTLPGTMQTTAGRAEAHRRADFLRSFLRELESELSAPAS